MTLTIFVNGRFLRTDEATGDGVTFEFVNGIFDGGRSSYTTALDLSVPADAANSAILSHNRQPNETGQRHSVTARMGCGGKSIDGNLAVTSLENGRFELQFTFAAAADWVYSGLRDLGVGVGEFVFSDKYGRGAVTSVGYPQYVTADCGASNAPYNGGAAIPPAVNVAHLIASICASRGWRFTFNGVEVTDGDFTGKPADHPSRFVLMPGGCTTSTPTRVAVNYWNSGIRSALKFVVGGVSDASPWPALTSHGLTPVFTDVIYWVRSSGDRGDRRKQVAALKATRDIKVRVAANQQIAVCNWLGYPMRPSDIQGAHVIDLPAGTVVAFADASAWSAARGGFIGESAVSGTAFDNLMQGFAFEVLEDGRQASAGDTVDLGQLCPDWTMAELLDEMCVVVPSTWTADEETATVEMTTLDHILADPQPMHPRVTEIETLTRYIDGFAQHNAVKAADTDENGEYGWSRDYPMATDLVDEEGEYAALKCCAGSPWGSDYTLYLNNTDRVTDGNNVTTGWKWSGKPAIGYCTDSAAALKHLWWFDTMEDGQTTLHDIIMYADEMAVDCVMPFASFCELSPRTVAWLNGKKWLVRSAAWQDGECRLTLVKVSV